MAHVAVIVVNWNSWGVLERCLQCLEQQTYRDFTVTVLDNASTEPAPATLSGLLKRVNLVSSAQNLGFAAANNLGVNQHSGNSEWVALLNPDAYAQPDWLEKLMQASTSFADCSVFASRQISAGKPHLLDGDGDVYHISGRAWRAGHSFAVPQGLPSVEAVFSPCAAAGLYRRSAFVEVGGFDEDFFCYFEDIDLGFRLQLAGYHCLLIREAVVHHLGSGSAGGAHGDFAVYHGHRNLVWTFVKNMPGPLFWLLLPLHLAINLVTLVHYVHRPRVIWRAKRDALRGLPKILRSRYQIQSARRTSLLGLWRIFNKNILPK